MKGHLIVPEQLINIVCRQNVEWDVEQDRDDDDCDEGVEMTKV